MLGWVESSLGLELSRPALPKFHGGLYGFLSSPQHINTMNTQSFEAKSLRLHTEMIEIWAFKISRLLHPPLPSCILSMGFIYSKGNWVTPSPKKNGNEPFG